MSPVPARDSEPHEESRTGHLAVPPPRQSLIRRRLTPSLPAAREERLRWTVKDIAMKTNPQEEGSARAAGRQGACQRVRGQARDTAVPQKGRALWAGCCQHGGEREAGSDGTRRSRRPANPSSDEQTFNTAASMEDGPQWGQWDQACQSKHRKASTGVAETETQTRGHGGLGEGQKHG